MPRYNTYDIPDSDLEKIAAGMLDRPRNFIAYDSEVYQTHGLAFAWADRGDDLVAESNYHVMLAELKAVIENGDAQPEDLIEGSESHWAVGHLSTLYVRVIEECPQHAAEDECGCPAAWTKIFKVAAGMLYALRDYSILDDDDHSEREIAAWMAVVEDALSTAARDHCEDSPAERVAFETLLVDGTRDEPYPDLYDLFSHGDSSPECVDWSAVSDAYDRVRDAHFEWLAWWWQHSPMPGQQALELPVQRADGKVWWLMMADA